MVASIVNMSHKPCQADTMNKLSTERDKEQKWLPELLEILLGAEI
jgi:hypothetical protein